MRERFLKLNNSAIRGRNRSFYLSAIVTSMGKSDDDNFPCGKEFLDELSRVHTDFGEFNSDDDDEGFDEEETVPVSFPGDDTMNNITEKHCQTFFSATRVDGEKVAVVCGRPSKECNLHRISRRDVEWFTVTCVVAFPST